MKEVIAVAETVSMLIVIRTFFFLIVVVVVVVVVVAETAVMPVDIEHFNYWITANKIRNNTSHIIILLDM